MPTTERPRTTETLNRSTHTIFFGTDDIGTVQERTKIEITADESDETDAVRNTEENKEWKDTCDIARDIFRVYFSTDESFSEMEKSKELREKRFFAKINGTIPWLTGYLKSLHVPGPISDFLLFVEACLRGIGQVFFQNNPLSGLFMLVALFIQSTRVAVHGVIALVVGNMAGKLMGFDESFVSCGEFAVSFCLTTIAHLNDMF